MMHEDCMFVIYASNMRKVFYFVCLLSILSSCKSEGNILSVKNPYEGIENKIRQKVISHEHITNQKKLESVLERGIDVLCISNYSPAVPVFPVSGSRQNYLDWAIVTENGSIIYEKDSIGQFKSVRVGDETYKKPVLEKVNKTFEGGFSDFHMKDGLFVDLTNIPQLPNAEHTHYYWPEESDLTSTKHLNFICTLWADVGNGSDDIEGLSIYNEENGYTLTSANFCAVFPMWSFTEMLDSVRSNLLYPGKVFGTINHPGLSGLEDKYMDAFIAYGKDIFKGIEIYNNSITQIEFKQNIDIYDHVLMRGYKLWCVAANDWGIIKKESALPYQDNEGCDLLYLDKSYLEKTPTRRAEMSLDALIEGSFSAVGFGTIDLSEVHVDGLSFSVLFDCVPDRTVIDIDGHRTEGGSVALVSVTLNSSNKFVRFEAYKGDDFIFTQPFFVEFL